MKPKRIRPVEFWLNTRLERIYFDSDASCPDDEVHVIEYRAYKELQSALELWTQRNAKLQQERDAYATAFKISLEDGIFSQKETTRQKIVKVLGPYLDGAE